MSSTTTATTTTVPACPYAAALPPQEEEEEGANKIQQQCPAFAQGSCPFKNAKNSAQIKQTLQQMPESHYNGTKNNSFLHVLQEMHQIKAPSAFQIPGGCPVLGSSSTTTSSNGGGNSSVSFRQALEQMSLAAIMASLLLEEEEGEEEREESKESETTNEHKQEHTFDKDANTTTTATTTTTTTTRQHVSSLSESLKTGTATSHQAAENVHFVKNFIQGKIDRVLYANLVGMLYHVYVALEQCLDAQAPQQFASCHFPHELRRTEALACDVDFWWGTTTPPVSKATGEYVQRLHFLAQHDPLLLLAHAYTRYLGDLSGGKVLARVARRALSLEQDGLDFYEFAHIQSIKLFKDRYRQALDALPLSEQQIQRVVAEANVAFCLNMRLFEELDVQANVPGARVRPLDEALAYATQTIGQDAAAAPSEECPFLKTKHSPPTTTDNNNNNSNSNHATTTKRCPWPFVFAHDPVQGMKDWQTGLVLGLLMCWVWSMVQGPKLVE